MAVSASWPGTDRINTKKDLVVPAVAAAAVSIACNLWLQSVREDKVPDVTGQAVEDLAVAVGTNSSSIALVHSELRAVRALLSGDYTPSTGAGHGIEEVTVNDLMDRIDAIEDAVDKLSAARPGGTLPGKDGSDGLAKFLAGNSQSAVETTAVFESDFESDSGKPLGDFPDSIDQALHAIDGLEVKGVDCRNTICKVAYSRPESHESRDAVDPENELVDRLALSAPGREVEVRYDKDTFGGNIMYIRLR